MYPSLKTFTDRETTEVSFKRVILKMYNIHIQYSTHAYTFYPMEKHTQKVRSWK